MASALCELETNLNFVSIASTRTSFAYQARKSDKKLQDWWHYQLGYESVQ